MTWSANEWVSLTETDRDIKVGALTETPNEDPLFESFSRRSLDGEIDGQAQEWVGKTIVRGRLGGYDVS
jgi:hypothetical protein